MKFRNGRCPVRFARGCVAFLSLVVLGGLSIPAAQARLFSYAYEPKVESKGELEFEQWVTSRIGKQDGDFTAWDFREEVEYGLTDRLLTALYFNFGNKHTDDVKGQEDGDTWEFQGVSSEWIYLLQSMKDNPIGVAAYGEVTISDYAVELEEKLIIGQRYDRWAWAANATVEQEWEDEDGGTEEEGVLELTGGAAYLINNAWSTGVEARHEQVFHDFTDQEANATFLGPNVHYHGDEWSATLTVLPQIFGGGEGEDDNLQLNEFERVEIRLIASVEF